LINEVGICANTILIGDGVIKVGKCYGKTKGDSPDHPSFPIIFSGIAGYANENQIKYMNHC
jgi:hypothetical protein